MKKYLLAALAISAVFATASAADAACIGNDYANVPAGGTVAYGRLPSGRWAPINLDSNCVLQSSGAGGGSGGAVTVADGADVTLGSKADPKNTASDTTPITAMQVWKQISFSVQAAASSLVTAVTSLASIVTSTAATVTGIGTPADTAWTSGSGSITAILKALGAKLDSLVTAVGSPIPQACTGNIPISQITSTDLKTGTGKIYICSIKITSGDAENLSLVEGTGTVCATSTVALDGATTAANGNQIAANGGWAEVSPTYMFNTSVTANHICLLQSGTGRVAGHITYSDH